MPALAHDFETPAARFSNAPVVLDLIVNNHPGVMSHLCGLFARRAFNVEGILCLPIGSGDRSRIWLLVHEDERLDQVLKQVGKLEDVRSVRVRDPDRGTFARLEEFFEANP